MSGKITLAASLALATALCVGGASEALAARCTLIIGASENPPVVSNGRGRFLIDRTATDTLAYRLRYSIPGAEVTQAHIHIANPGNNGGIAAFLCGGAGAPVCPSPSGLVEDEFGADDVRRVDDEDSGATIIQAGDLDGLFKLIRDGATYVNVHTQEHTTGEIRCQINPRER
jgi:hypothetical protein